MPGIRYRQIAEDLRFKIESGELGRGTQLPTEPELSEQYGASRNTVRDAIKLLITRGLAQTRPGRGTFVVEEIDPYVTVLTGEAGTYLRRGIGLDQVGYRDKVTVRRPDANESAFFRRPDDRRVAVFGVLRTAFDRDGRPSRLTVTSYPTDRNQFTINVGQVPDDLEWPGSPADQQGEHGP